MLSLSIYICLIRNHNLHSKSFFLLLPKNSWYKTHNNKTLTEGSLQDYNLHCPCVCLSISPPPSLLPHLSQMSAQGQLFTLHPHNTFDFIIVLLLFIADVSVWSLAHFIIYISKKAQYFSAKNCSIYYHNISFRNLIIRLV